MNIKISSSFSARLSLWVILIAAAVFVTAFVAFFHAARERVREEASSHAREALSTTVQRVNHVLETVEIAVRNAAPSISERLDNPDAMYGITRQLLENNPMIAGSAIAFEPGYYAEKGVLYSPYAYRNGDHIDTLQLGTEEYDYPYMDWYQIPKLLDCSYWSEPYYDDGGGEMIMTTYAYPLHDAEGKLYAIFTADLSLEWLTEEVNKMHPYPRSYNLMVGRGGAYLVHSDRERLLVETVFTATLEMADTTVREIGQNMVDGREGMSLLQNDDTLSYVFYAPIQRTGWSVGLVCPYDDVFQGVESTRNYALFIAFIGVILLGITTYRTVRRMTHPLTKFAESAKRIAMGDFNAPLPQIESRDEMLLLHDSFQVMQRSLVTYMDELRTTTANKERIESELRIASEIQMGMIPKIFPPFPDRDDIDLFATLTPAKEVGGDLYDFFIENNRLYFTIGDVSGKGVPASLLMAVTRSLFRTMSGHLDQPSGIVRSLNESISESNESGMFCTLFLGILDLQTGKLAYCNAGHNAPLIATAQGEAHYMDIKANLPLGLFAGFPYEQQETTLHPGEKLLLYTDGVTEAENPAHELFSDERLQEFLQAHQNEMPRPIVEQLKDEVHRFADGADQSDDITILCLQYSGQNAQNENKPIQADTIMKKQLIIQNEIGEIAKLATFVESIGEELNLAPDLVFNLNLVLEEAVSNIILYAYPKEMGKEISVQAEKIENKLIFTLTDSGKEFDPTKEAPDVDVNLSAEERGIGGLGIFLIKNIMNEVEYQRVEGRNVFTLKKDI